MITTVPNIYALEYVTTVGVQSAGFTTKAVDNICSGQLAPIVDSASPETELSLPFSFNCIVVVLAGHNYLAEISCYGVTGVSLGCHCDVVWMSL